MNSGIILSYIGDGISAKRGLIKMWQKELALLEDSDVNKEKAEKLKKYIKQAEDCILVMRKSEKLTRNLRELGELERYY